MKEGRGDRMPMISCTPLVFVVVSIIVNTLPFALCLRTKNGSGMPQRHAHTSAFVAKPRLPSPSSTLRRFANVLTIVQAGGRAQVLGGQTQPMRNSMLRGAEGVTSLFATKVEGGGPARHSPASLEAGESIAMAVDRAMEQEGTLDEEMDLTRDEVMEIILENQKLLSSIVESRPDEDKVEPKGKAAEGVKQYSVKELEKMDDDAIEDVFERVVASLESLTPREQMLAEVLADPSLLPDNLRSPEKLLWLKKEASLAEIEEVFDQYYAAEEEDDDVDDDADDNEVLIGDSDANGNQIMSTYNPTGSTLASRYGLTRETAIDLIVDNNDLIDGGRRKLSKTSLSSIDDNALLALIDEVVTGFDAEMEEKGMRGTEREGIAETVAESE